MEKPNHIKPIRFKVLSEDGTQAQEESSNQRIVNRSEKNLFNKENGQVEQEKEARLSSRKRKQLQQQQQQQQQQQKQLEPNFSFEYSYPAVIFEKVCFSVNRSQQQSNFLNELIFRLKHCLGSSSLADKQEQKVEILKSINLNVPYGSIFGLLGPSSCGKTTLLRCLVGLLKPESGLIRLFCHASEGAQDKKKGDTVNDQSSSFCCHQWAKYTTRFQHNNNNNNSNGSSPASHNKSKVPGSNVGYMPQDLGLYEDFTIRQLLTMFGQYVGMQADLIKTRIEFMAKFLDLPDVGRQIQSLSGGQKRRVSFAIACLHMPPLIILDEPTVGVDPLLRQSIWKYLRRLADKERKTIIITTHYIEEAAQADQVALMRAGEILVQDTPTRIMESNNCKTLEEAFLRICNNVSVSNNNNNNNNNKQQQQQQDTPAARQFKLYPQPRFDWHNKMSTFGQEDEEGEEGGGEDEDCEVKKGDLCASSCSLSLPGESCSSLTTHDEQQQQSICNNLSPEDKRLWELRLKAQEKLNLFDSLQKVKLATTTACHQHNVRLNEKINRFSLEPNISEQIFTKSLERNNGHNTLIVDSWTGEISNSHLPPSQVTPSFNSRQSTTIMEQIRSLRGTKFVLNKAIKSKYNCCDELDKDVRNNNNLNTNNNIAIKSSGKSFTIEMSRCFTLMWALLYKNYRRNVNSLPLLAFQFMLPIIQMISFSLCVGGRPTNIGLGLVNYDQLPLISLTRPDLLIDTRTTSNSSLNVDYDDETSSTSLIVALGQNELLSHRYLSFIDQTMITIKPYANLKSALDDVRRAKLWAAMEIGENFTSTVIKRFDLDNFYNLDSSTIKQSVIKLYPDRSNKVLDMICHRSLVNSYRQFLSNQFEHFKRLPIEVKEPIFDIKANLISNSIDGYTESIAAGLLASLTYIMAAGLTTFIMVVERSAGILERTYTSGISPVAYLLAHAVFRSFVMMIQIAVVMFLTFYLLQQPMVGSIWLAYLMLMTLNLTGIAYGLLISSLVTDQNGAALTIVSSLVVKITMSGILWPFEAIPHWLRAICYIQPLTMPVQALKTITLKGNGIEDRSVYLGFIVSLSWLALFLTISAKRFKFYQH